VAVGLVGATVLVALIVMWLRPFGVEGDPRKSLIVFPFENRTGDTDNDWLQEAAMHGLGLTLAHWDELRVFDDERTASLMRRRGVEDAGAVDFDLARRMAREAQVGTLVLGDIRREGRLLTIEAKVHDVRSGERLATEIVQGQSGSDPRFLFDSLAARILQVSGAPPGERPGVVAQTTHSLDAYRAYLTGTEALHQFALDSAEARLRRAVELDSAFALAYLQLRNVYGWRGAGDEERRAFISQAETHGRTLPPRLKMLLEYYVAYENGHLREARSIAERLIARDSGDVETWYQLGEAHLHHASGFPERAPIPHADSLGNIGKALLAFERALELDSSYILAYRHIVDALEVCSRRTTPWVCVGDSAVYGDTDELRTRLGPSTVERLRGEAAEDLVATAYRWVAAAPTAELPRERIFQVLLDQERFEEAERQLSALANLAPGPRVAAYDVLISLANHRFREAGEGASEVVQAVSGPQELGVPFAWNYFDDAFLSAGRVQDFEDLVGRAMATMPGDDAPLGLPPPANQIRVPKRVWRKLQGLDAVAVLFTHPDSTAPSRAAHELLDVGEASLAGDSLARRLLMERNRDLFLFLYLASRDSTILSRLLPYLRPGEFPAARAHLALARSDTTGARELLNGHNSLAGTRPADFTSEREFFDAFFWATVLAELGDLRGAVTAYAQLDSTPFAATTFPVLPLTWAERGALRQQLGDSSEAIELYEKFIDAWRDADEELQWQVEQAKAAVAALRGAPYPMTER
jgi:tetratricopeptide (TPR) repeat protein